MFRFVKKLFGFLLITLAVIFTIIILPLIILRKHSDFKIDNDTTIVVFGHSHPECAFNDTIIPNFRNLGQSGESYFYSYQKMKKVIKQNPNVQTVLIEYTNNQIWETIHEWIWGKRALSDNFPRYAPFLSSGDFQLLWEKNNKDFLSGLSVSSRSNIGRILSHDFNYDQDIGGFRHLDKTISDSVLASAAKDKSKKVHHEISMVSLSYLKKMIEFCFSRNIQVYLVRSPLNPYYFGFNDETRFLSLLEEHFPSVDFLDFSKFPLKNSEYADFQHLNYKGAEFFSHWFKSLLDSGLLDRSDKKEFIKTQMSAWVKE